MVPETAAKDNTKHILSPEAQKIRDNYVNKILRVETKNARVFYGKLQIIDDKCNLLLG